MKTCIALLRGINVGGQKSVKMADLTKLFSGMGFKQVRTYLQSGNVVFEDSGAGKTGLAERIEKKISDEYAFEVRVVVRTKDEMAKIVAGNPLLREPGIDIEKLHVTFLRDVPDASAVLQLNIKKDKNELYVIQGKEIYLYCPNGYGRTKLNNSMFEKKLNTAATTRNWNTVKNLLET